MGRFWRCRQYLAKSAYEESGDRPLRAAERIDSLWPHLAVAAVHFMRAHPPPANESIKTAAFLLHVPPSRDTTRLPDHVLRETKTHRSNNTLPRTTCLRQPELSPGPISWGDYGRGALGLWWWRARLASIQAGGKCHPIVSASTCRPCAVARQKRRQWPQSSLT